MCVHIYIYIYIYIYGVRWSFFYDIPMQIYKEEEV